jgi:hypothetical protein
MSPVLNLLLDADLHQIAYNGERFDGAATKQNRCHAAALRTAHLIAQRRLCIQVQNQALFTRSEVLYEMPGTSQTDIVVRNT